MRINNNITAENASRQRGISAQSMASTTEKLSSGMRVNRAADDAAGLAISEKMRTQIRGLNRASLNIQDGASLLQVGDGALQAVHDKMQRLRELAVQAANDTNELIDREMIQLEFGQLTSEINSVVSQTNFNGRLLFDGSIGASIEQENLAIMEKRGIMGVRGQLMSNSLGQAHPVDISYGAKTLSVKQQRVLEQLPNDGSRHTFHKNDVSMMDLSALTAHTGNEFAMFTHEGNRVVYRGNGERVYFPPKELNELMASGARFSGHTHTGTDLTPSKEDLDFLRMIGQKTSSIYNIYGRHEVIRLGG